MIILIFAFYAFSKPNCNDPHAFQWFYDDLCFITVDKKFIYASLFTAGFLTYDFRIQKGLSDAEEEADVLLLFHHVFGVVEDSVGIDIMKAIHFFFKSWVTCCRRLLRILSSSILND